MIKKLSAICAILFISVSSHAFSPVRYVRISTNTLTMQTGTFNVFGGTVAGGPFYSTGTNTLGGAGNSVTISSNLVVSGGLLANNSAGTAGQTLESQGPGSTPTWVTVSTSSVLSTTNTWTAAQNLSSATITALSVSTITPTNIVGNTSGTAAPVGDTGEYITSTVGAGNCATTSQYGDVTNIALTAGDWQVSGSAMFNINGATWSQGTAGISNTSGNSTIGLTNGDTVLINSWLASAVTPTFVSVSIQPFRVLASGATTYYLKALSAYTGGPPTVLGRISARRTR